MVEFGSSAPGAFSIVPVDGHSFLTLVNGDRGSTGTIKFVPEPRSLVLLALVLPVLAMRAVATETMGSGRSACRDP